jgi:integrase
MSSVKSYAAKTGPGGRLWEVHYRTPENRATRKRGFRTKRDAESWRTSMEAAKQTGTYVAPSAGRVTVGQVGEQWKNARGHLKASTIANSETAWRRVQARWGTTEVGKVRTAHVRSWVAQMVADGVGVESIENAYSCLRQVMATAVEDRRIAVNPCDKVKLPRRGNTHLDCLSHERVAALAAAVEARAPGYGTVPRFIAYTGLRWNELAALRVKCVDLEGRRVQVLEGVTEVKGELVWGTPKTYERRTVPFPAFLSGELAALVKGKGPNDLVFTDSAGGVLRVSNFRPRVFDPARDKCIEADPHFPRVTLRKLRNTAASLAISSGATVKAVQAMLGHKNAAMTLNTYASLFPSDLDDVAVRLHRAAAVPDVDHDLAELLDRLSAVEMAAVALSEHPEASAGPLAAAVAAVRGHVEAARAAVEDAAPGEDDSDSSAA